MLLAALFTAYFCTCAFALPPKRDAADGSTTIIHLSVTTTASVLKASPTRGPHSIPLVSGNADDSLLFASIDIGDGMTKSLIVSTDFTDMLLNHDSYTVENKSSPWYALITNEHTFGKTFVRAFSCTLRWVTMSVAGLAVNYQQFRYPMVYVDNLPSDGIWGLKFEKTNGTSFLATMCDQHTLSPCKFSLTLDSGASGTLTLGESIETSTTGNQVVAPILKTKAAGWSITGSVRLIAQGEETQIVGQTFAVASESFYVMGNPTQVTKLFADVAGATTPVAAPWKYNYPWGSLLYWNVPCEAKLADFGFQFDSIDTDATGPAFFGFDSSAFIPVDINGTNDLCQAPIVSFDGVEENTWLLGQLWLRGKFVEFNWDDETITIANRTTNDTSTERPDQNATTTLIPLRKQDDFWLIDNVTVGAGSKTALRVDTIASNLIMQQSQYTPKGQPEQDARGQVGPLLPMSFECTKSASRYSLYTDSFSVVDGIALQDADILAVENLGFLAESAAANSDYAGILGLSGKLSAPGVNGTVKSLLRSLYDEKKIPEYRFGMAINSAPNVPPGPGNTVGALVLGGVNYSMFEGALQPIPIQPAPKSDVYAAQAGQWWARGSISIGEGTAVFGNQSIYFNLNSDKISGSYNAVSALFLQVPWEEYKVKATQSCNSYYEITYDCASPPPISIAFTGVEGAIPLFGTTANFGKDPDNETMCSFGIEGRWDLLDQPDFWSFGLPWFNGRYIDFNADANVLNIAPLVSTALPAPSVAPTYHSVPTTVVKSSVETVYETQIITSGKKNTTETFTSIESTI